LKLLHKDEVLFLVHSIMASHGKNLFNEFIELIYLIPLTSIGSALNDVPHLQPSLKKMYKK